MLLEIGIPTIIMLNILLRVILHHGTKSIRSKWIGTESIGNKSIRTKSIGSKSIGTNSRIDWN